MKRIRIVALILILGLLFCGCRKEKGQYLPVLMYHDVNDEKEESGTVVHSDTFEKQMQFLRDNGFTPVSASQVIGFVQSGAPLPEKCVMITFDDGYRSNYDLAFPILRQFGFPAAIFAVGFSFGASEFYKDTDHRLTPHFGADEAREMIESGLVTVGSHTFDMHQWAPFEEGNAQIRENILPLSGESETQYREALEADMQKQNALFAASGLPIPDILAYPNGKTTPLTQRILRENGIVMTFTTDCNARNYLRTGEADTLFDLGRLCMEGATSEKDLLRYLNG